MKLAEIADCRGWTESLDYVTIRVSGRQSEKYSRTALQAGGRRFEPCTAHHFPNENDVFERAARNGCAPFYLGCTLWREARPLILSAPNEEFVARNLITIVLR